MTLAEIKSAIDEMALQDKLAIEAYARAASLTATPSFQLEMQERAKAMESGVAFSSNDVRELHDLMTRKGL